MSACGRIVILGAGPCGLGAALWLSRKGYDDFLVLEGQAHPGGLSASFVDDAGFVWDLGGHVVFSHFVEFDALLDRVVPEWISHERQSWIRTQGRWVPYPFQYNIHRLDPVDRDAVLNDLRERAGRPAGPSPDSFAKWIRDGFGPAMGRLFLEPYNWKVWGYPLETMGAGWMGERVAAPDYERVLRAVRENRDDPGWGPNAKFRFPAAGGTGAIWRGAAALPANGKIRYGARVDGIDLSRRTARLSDGTEERWDCLISRAPIDWLCRTATGLSSTLSRAVDGLGYNSTHVIGVGLRGGKPADLTEKCWMYFPDSTSPYYRVTHFSHYGPGNAPPGCWSLMAEVCESPHKRVDAKTVEAESLSALRADGLIEAKAEVVSTWHRRLEMGYPVPLQDRDEILHAVMPRLEENGVLSRGRFGGWKYEIGNMDHCFMQGAEAAARLVSGTAERTWIPS